MYGQGISRAGEIIDLGVDANVIQKSGAWMSYQGNRIGQGRENAKNFLMDNPELMAELENAVLKAHGLIESESNSQEPTPKE